MSRTDLAELRRLHEAATKGEWQVNGSHIYGPDPERVLIAQTLDWPANSRDFIVAAHNATPALLDELEAARLEMRRQASVIAELREEVRQLFEQQHHTKLIGAAEELEQSAKTLREDLADMNPPEFASRGKVAPGYCECLQDVADGMEERAAQLRREAEDV